MSFSRTARQTLGVRIPSRPMKKHLPAIATAFVLLWLMVVYVYSASGNPASAGRMSLKRLVKTALGGKAPREPLERRSRPVTVDVDQATTAYGPTDGETRRDPRRARRKSARNGDPRASAPASGHSLPVAPRLVSAAELREPHHDYAALDLSLRTGTKIRAVTDGKVKATTRWGACGKGVILKGRDNFTYTYCHGDRLHVGKGRRVDAGHTIMRSGNTGDSTGPHLHLQIRRPDGKLVCPQDLLPEWGTGIAKSPWKAKRHGCHSGGHRHQHKDDDQRKGKRR